MIGQESLKNPRLSVIVACTHSRLDLELVLSSLRGQEGADGLEIIVVDSSGDEAANQSIVQDEGVLTLRFPRGTPLPALWGAGIRQSRGAIIAVTDACSVPDRRWVLSTQAAHESSDLIVGGAVDPMPQRSLVDWAAYFCEYGQFMLPLTGGDVSELPGNNIAFKRAALDKGTQFVEQRFWKTYWCRALQQVLSAAPISGQTISSRPLFRRYEDYAGAAGHTRPVCARDSAIACSVHEEDCWADHAEATLSSAVYVFIARFDLGSRQLVVG